MMQCVPIGSLPIKRRSCATSVVKIWVMYRRLLMDWRKFSMH